MGLDLIEFTVAVEDSFQLSIPRADAEAIHTPGQLVDYLVSRLPQFATSACLEQCAFYALRGAAVRVLGSPRSAIGPETRWADIMPSNHRRRHWRLLQHATGSSKWPGLTPWGTLPKRHSTIGGTARYLAIYSPGAFMGRPKRWSRVEVERVIGGLMREQLGITEFEWDQRFVQDLGLN
jgi:hypothetical protein